MAAMTATRAALIAVSALLLAACSGNVQPEVSGPAAPPATSQTAPQPSETVEPDPTPEAAPGDSNQTASFGQTATFPGGLAVSVSQPQVYHPSDTAAGAGRYNVGFTVTLKNGTPNRFDPSGVFLRAADSQGDVEPIYDNLTNGDSVGPSPTTSIRAGKTVSWKVAYAVHVKSLSGLTVEVSILNLSDAGDSGTATFEN